MTETIMMIHGMWGGGWYWKNYKNFFEEKGYHCITPTLRFHDMDPNETPNPQLGTTSLLDYVEDLEKEIKKLDAPPILMGHSMGGLLAQILGSRGLAKALVLLTPAPPYGIVALKPSVIKSFQSGLKKGSFWRDLMKYGFWTEPFRQTFYGAVYSMLHLLTVQEQKEVFANFVYESGRAACEIGFWFVERIGFWFVGPKGAAKVDESKITCPVLVVAGAQDKITPTSVVQKVADKYKAVSTYKKFKNHAHWVIEEPGWQEIAEYISDWLNRVLSEIR